MYLFLWMSSNIEDNSWKWPCSTILSASSITRYLKCSKRQTYSSPWNWTPPADTSRIIHLIERGYTPISPLGIWKRKKTPGTDVYRAVENAYSCTYHFWRRFTNGKTYTTLEIQIHAENYTGQPISWETYLHVQVCVDCFRSLKESESVQLMIHEVLTSEIKSHSLPGVATIISGHLFKSLCCFWGAIPPTTATILKKKCLWYKLKQD